MREDKNQTPANQPTSETPTEPSDDGKPLALIATGAFGLEAVIKRELQTLGYAPHITQPGRIEFSGNFSAICRTNLWLRSADRVLIKVGQFEAADFDQLFDTTQSLPWENWIAQDAEFPVNAKTLKSQITSVPALQRSVKRAIVDRLIKAHNTNELPETGPKVSIELSLIENQATLTLDTTGPSLHKRGYRKLVGLAPLKETLAAALIQLSVWKAERPLIDPFCGSGTIPIEAAMLARNIAPGADRTFSAEAWPQIPSADWSAAREEARDLVRREIDLQIIGSDIDPEALELARFHAQRARVTDDIHFQQQPFDQLRSRREYGCLITNPPYGMRLEETSEVERLYQTIPGVLQRLPTWSHFVLTAAPSFERIVQRKATRRRKLYNGRIECTYYQFLGPRPPRDSHVSNSSSAEPAKTSPLEADSIPADQEKSQAESPSESTAVRSNPTSDSSPSVEPVFGRLDAKADEQAALFETRLRKRAKHLRRWPTSQGITCFRLYERDIPEIPLVVDRYEDSLHITEYERPHTRDLGQHAAWLELMKKTAARALDIPIHRVALKSRERLSNRQQYTKQSDRGQLQEVHEGGLRFLVNLTDYIDTGLFLDHRITRSKVRDEAKDKRVLNLFAYTGSFSVYAADGGAISTVTLDASRSYLDWAKQNLEINGFDSSEHSFVRADAQEYLEQLPATPQFDLAIVDPPTFSNSTDRTDDWDLQRDHAKLLTALIARMPSGAVIYFSTNFRRFRLDESQIPGVSFREISRQTVPPDFRNQRIHRCWRLVVV